MEEVGSGLVKVYQYCKAYTGFDPVIEDGEDIFKVSIKTNFFEDTFPKEERIVPAETRVKTRVKIIELINNNPNITREEMAKELNLTLKGIEWQIKNLQKNNIIERVGADKGGYWKIKK